MENYVSFPGLGIKDILVKSEAFSVFGTPITWYSLIITTGIIVAVLYIWRRFKEAGLPTEDLLDMALWVIPCGIIGARLYYVIFEFDHFWVEGEFWESMYNIIAMWEGGLAIYGGIIAGGIAAALVARHKKISIFKTMDMLAPAVMLAQSIGRWGNFTNVEAFGGPTTLPWRMCSRRIASNFYGNFNDSELFFKVIEGEIGAHPTFLYESLWNLTGFLVIYFVFVRPKKYHKFEGQLFYSYLTWYGLGRLWIEGLRTDSLYLIDGVIRVSQLVALLSLIAGVSLLIAGFVMLKKNKEVFFAMPIKAAEAKKEETTENNKKEENKNGNNNQRKRSSAKGKRKH